MTNIFEYIWLLYIVNKFFPFSDWATPVCTSFLSVTFHHKILEKFERFKQFILSHDVNLFSFCLAVIVIWLTHSRPSFKNSFIYEKWKIFLALVCALSLVCFRCCNCCSFTDSNSWKVISEKFPIFQEWLVTQKI